MIRAGNLKHVAELNILDRNARDLSGQQAPRLTFITNFRCEVLTSIQANKRFASGSTQDHQIVFHCRFIPGIEYKPDLVIRHREKLFSVSKIDNPGGFNKELFITAEVKPNE